MTISQRDALLGAASADAAVISLERERIRRRIRRRLIELREYRERVKNDPAAEERSRRIAEITEIVIEEVMDQSVIRVIRPAGEARP